jgi:beta-xylosidase
MQTITSKGFYNYNKNLLKAALLLLVCLTLTEGTSAQTKLKAGAWGDQLNGTYKNPIINADYSDPDVIKVGDNFYMVCSDFHFMGMPVLQSTDLVNWHIIGQVYNRLDLDPKYNNMDKYGGGSWAPSLRFHNNKFYVYFCTPDEGLYMSTATNPAGPWAPLTEVKRTGGWEDPCPFWDTDGQAYLGHSKLGAGPIIIHKLSADGTKLLDDGKTVYESPVAEGTKIYKRNGYYYIIIPEGGVGTGYETALRSKDIYGPYERKIVLEKGTTNVNGPHQGGLVDLDSGESWFIHFQDAGSIGRVCWLEPVKWINDWPFMGVDNDANGIGEPVITYAKPKVAKAGKPVFIQTSDEFNSPRLSLQWQWNHNPVNDSWSLKSPKGYLALTALMAVDNKHARNTITQKLMGKQGTITTLLDVSQMQTDQKAGLCLLGNYIHEVGVVKIDTSLYLYADNNGRFEQGIALNQSKIYLRVSVDIYHKSTVLQYSLDGENFNQLGEACELADYNYWKAVRPGLFSYNTNQNGGKALFDWFHYTHDGTSVVE